MRESLTRCRTNVLLEDGTLNHFKILWVNDDGVEVLIAHTADEFRHQLVQRDGVAAQVPDCDVPRVLLRQL